MAIAPGAQFDHYEILSQLGAGGMGEVYRARDTRLDRAVAIKVLPAEFAHDADRLRRFEQEAMATSALNHPNILTVYDFGNYEGNPYLVMELLDGEELRAQLDEGALPIRKAIEYAQQIAAGLAAAHEKSIVHRDLKPENLFITKDNRVKILDFGLAKLRPVRNADFGMQNEEAETLVQGDPNNPQSPIRNPQLTAPGTVMGTVAYMSPEQVRGQDLDHRSDIFSFGIILYEMLSGQRAFTGEMMADVMSAITRDDPPELTNAKISPALDKIVRRCLEKKPEHRFQTASDLGFALSTLTTPSGARLETATAVAAVTESAPVSTARWFGNARLAWLAAAVLLLVSLLSLPFAVKSLRQSPPAAPMGVRFTIAAPEKITAITAPELSPDGRHLVFVATTEGKTSLWLRPLGSLTAQPLPGTEGIFGLPIWSPDSRSIGFFAGGELKKLELAGGAPQTLCKLGAGSSAFLTGNWNRDGVIFFLGIGGTFRVPATGGEPERVSNRLGQLGNYRWPVFLPDGRHFLILRLLTQGSSEIHLAALGSQETTRLLAADSQARYANGHLFFARAGALLAAPFDAVSLKLTGEPFVVTEKVRVGGNSIGYFSISENGSLAYDPNVVTDNHQLTWLDREGQPLGTVGPPGEYFDLRLAPDGKRVAVARRDAQSRSMDIYVIDVARGTSSRLTFDPGDDRFPVWSPDGSRIAWQANRDGAYQMYQKLASGVGPEELLLKEDVLIAPGSWSVDNRFLLYTRRDRKTTNDLWVLPLTGDRQPLLFLQTPFAEFYGRFSPDGRWIAYTSNDQGRNEVYVQTFPASGGKWQISNNGGTQSRWRSDGKELYYLSNDGKLMVVEVKPGGSFEASALRALFDLAPSRALGGNGYVLTAAGDRFLFVTEPEQAASQQFTVVTNWAAEVKK
jgi:Tol biopolymer transport system component